MNIYEEVYEELTSGESYEGLVENCECFGIEVVETTMPNGQIMISLDGHFGNPATGQWAALRNALLVAKNARVVNLQPFSSLKLGAKFEHVEQPGQDGNVWVKIEWNEIASFEKFETSNHWSGQVICRFDDSEPPLLDTDVIVLEDK